jgi:ABC-type transporter Mla maintaining outer membrane lipid asymmetry ATPase subunit MlaF
MLLELNKVSLGYKEHILLDEVSMCLESGSSTCIKTGVLDGGSSLLRMCAGLMEPLSGRVMLNGQSLSAMSDQQKFATVSLSFEIGGLLAIFSNYNNVAFPLLYHTELSQLEIRSRIENLAQRLGVEHLLNLEPHQLNDVQTRLFNLLRSMAFRPELILVDELQSGMSDAIRQTALDVLMEEQQRHGFGVLMTVTAGDDYEFADNVLSISDKKLKGGQRELCAS